MSRPFPFMRRLLIFFGLAGLFLGWNAPNHYPPWPAFHLELFAGLGLCGLAAALVNNPRLAGGPRVALPLGMPARIWLLAAAYPLLQFALGMLPFRGDALLGFLYGVGVVLSLYCGQLWALQQGRERVWKTLNQAILVGALAACGLGLAQWLRLPPSGWWAMELIDDRPFANFAQPNHFGLLMVWGIVSVTALYESRAVERRGVWALAVAFLGAGVLMSQSRASALALVVVAALWFVTRRRTPTRLRVGEVLGAAGVGVAMALALEPLQQALLLSGPELRASAEVGPREAIWKHFAAAILHSPWWGHGFNQGVAAMAEVAAQVEPSRNVTFAHSAVLDLMTWVGVPLALLAMAGFGIWMLGWLRPAADVVLLSQRHTVFALWAVLVVQSLLEFPFAHSYFLIPAALLAGAVAGLPPSLASATPGTSFGFGRGAALLACVSAALLAVTTWEYLRLEDEFRYYRFKRANFIGLEVREPLGRPMVLDQLAALNASALMIPAPGMSTDELDKMHRLARRFHIPSVRLDYAKALALNGRLVDAEAELAIIRSVNPPSRWSAIQREWKQWLDATQRQNPGSPTP